MQRIFNDASRVTEEALDGIILCHSDLLAKTENPRVVRYKWSAKERSPRHSFEFQLAGYMHKAGL